MLASHRSRRLAGALAATTFCFGATAAAQGVPLDRFDPAPAGDRMFGVPSPFVAGHLVPHLELLFDYAHNPLVVRTLDDNQKKDVVLANDLFLHVDGSFALWNRLLLNIDVPIALVQSGATAKVGKQVLPAPNKPALGEVRGGLRVRLYGEYDDAFQLGLGGYVWFPTGPKNAYVGDGHVRGEPQLLLGGRGADRVVWSLAGGPEFRSTEVFAGVTQGTQWNFGGGIGFLLGEARHVQLGPEFYGAFTLAKGKLPADTLQRTTSLEALLDLRIRVVDDLEIAAGAGPGLTLSPGTPDFRGVFSIAYTPEMKKGRPDRDGDGIFDDEDACPDVKGVRTDDPKTNGCPSDRDGDGIIDEEDACPDVKGERSSDPKKNGCPKEAVPSDRDGDGIPDDEDACPDVKGVKTDDPKTNGCPLDTDGDGIPDDEDACPTEKGPKDPDPTKNGCPRVHVTDKEIVILEQVQFDTNKATIKRESDGLLDNVAEVFKAHADIRKVEVQGHTDDRGTPGLNKGLSQRRADAVVAALVSRGIARDRLVSKGFGQEVPIADNGTEEGRQKNRRVQFKIIERKRAN